MVAQLLRKLRQENPANKVSLEKWQDPDSKNNNNKEEFSLFFGYLLWLLSVNPASER